MSFRAMRRGEWVVRHVCSSMSTSHPPLHSFSSQHWPSLLRCGALQHHNHKSQRWISTTSSPAEPLGQEEVTALQMIDYVRSLTKGDDASYAEAVRVLEQGLTFFTSDQSSSVNAATRVQLTLATIHASMKNVGAAIEVLQNLVDAAPTTLEARVAALESLCGLCLQTYQDEAALHHAQALSDLINTVGDGLEERRLNSFRFRAAALKGLVGLVQRQTDKNISELFPNGSVSSHFEDATGAAFLACAEIFNVCGKFKDANDFYHKAVELASEELGRKRYIFSALAMIPKEVHVGALAGLGQLLMHTGNYSESEEKLTEALKLAEQYKGEDHAQVGMILSCLGELYWHRGNVEGGDALLIEGLYRSALNKLKAQPLDQEGDSKDHAEYIEIIALTRARLATNLASMSNRRNEAERLWQWAEAAWRNHRPLTEFVSEESLANLQKKPSVVGHETKRVMSMVVDVRLGRIF